MEKMCISCKRKPIKIKKWRRCLACYQKYRKKEGMKNCRSAEERPIAFPSEIEFIRSYFTHSNWIYHPANFKVNGSKYMPDFYDGERNVFIEVAGTRQAYYNNRAKYITFAATFPKLQFEIRYPDGVLLPLNETYKEKIGLSENKNKCV